MKKLSLLIAMAIFGITSCSKTDEPETDSTSSILVKKMEIAEKSNFSSITYTHNLVFTYSGKKLLSVTSTGSEDFKIEYTYSGDLITKEEFKDSDGVVEETTIYSYNSSGNLSSKTYSYIDSPDTKYTTDYTYNSDGTVNFTRKRTDILTNESKTLATGTLTFVKGNLTKTEENASDYTEVYEYEYDTKNNPFKNVVGLNKISNDSEGFSSVNNLTKSVNNYTATNGNLGTTNSVNTYTLSYDSFNFLTKEIRENDYYTQTTTYTY